MQTLERLTRRAKANSHGNGRTKRKLTPRQLGVERGIAVKCDSLWSLVARDSLQPSFEGLIGGGPAFVVLMRSLVFGKFWVKLQLSHISAVPDPEISSLRLS
jgi:hypothetical protein